MKYFGKAESVAGRILDVFKTGNVPEALAPIFIRRDGDLPCGKWSWSNQLLTALAGFDDARGFRQWESVGRRVCKGERAFYILAPCHRKVTGKDSDTGAETERLVIYGFRSVAVFGYEQTDGQPLPDREQERQFIDELPLIGVARKWGLSVKTYGGRDGKALGWYRHGQAIALGVENLSTWAHELIHAADDRLGNLNERGQHWRSETVAELGGAVLLHACGYQRDADLGGCWEYIRKYAEHAKIQPVSACMRVLNRVCKAVALVLETASELERATEIVAA